MDVTLFIMLLLGAIGAVTCWRLTRPRPAAGRCPNCAQQMIYITDLPAVLAAPHSPARKPFLFDDRRVALYGCTRCGNRLSVEY